VLGTEGPAGAGSRARALPWRVIASGVLGAARYWPLALLLATSCNRTPLPFSVERSRTHLQYLAGTIGARPAGSAAAARARAYITAELQRAGFDVRVQETDAERPELGLTGRVHNVIAYKPGMRPEAIGLVAHYDSVPTGPGAGDDAVGVAVCLEAARVLGARAQARWSVLVLLTDAEEDGLLGAVGVLKDSQVRSQLKAYINLDSTGTTLPLMLFQTGPGNGWMLDAWARNVPAPRGASYVTEVYTRLPNDTDFSIFASAGIPGLNFAAIGESYGYHLSLDTPDRVDNRLLLVAGQTMVATATALDALDVTTRTADGTVYFDLGGTTGVWWSLGTSRVVDLVSIALGLCALIVISGRLVRHAGWHRLLAAWGIAFLCAVTAAAAMVGASALLRSVREVYHPWHAHPVRLFVLLVLAGTAGAWVAARVAFGYRRASAEPEWSALSVWSVTLAVWLLGACALASTAPLAAYLLTLPLGFASALIMGSGARPRRLAVSSLLIGLACLALWGPAIAPLLPFLVTLLGRLPLITPVWLFPLTFAAAATVLCPPMIAVLRATGARRPPFVTRGLLTALAAAFAWAYMANAYSPSRPLRSTVQFYADYTAGRAFWQIESLEPGLHLDASAPSGWTAGPAPDRTASAPFVFHVAAALPDAPLEATYTSHVETDDVWVEVAARPRREAGILRFALPEGLTPLESSLSGRLRSGRWTALYAAAPLEGVTWRVRLTRATAPRLSDLRVSLRTALPGNGANGLPSWLPIERSQWEGSGLYVITPSQVTRSQGHRVKQRRRRYVKLRSRYVN
jgi:hypothetical protein